MGSRNLLYATAAGRETRGEYVSSCRVDSYVSLLFGLPFTFVFPPLPLLMYILLLENRRDMEKVDR